MAISNTALATAVSDLIAMWQDRETEMRAWLGGVVDGGPNDDGKYPLTDPDGDTQLVTCPAQLEDDVDDIVVGAGASASAASASASAAAASASAASTSAGNASTSATAASASASAAAASASTATTGASTATAQAATATAAAAQAVAAAGALTDPGYHGVMTWNNTSNTPAWTSALLVDPSTGSLTLSGALVDRPDLTSGLVLRGGSGAGSGAGLSVFGPSHATAPSYAYLDADLTTFRNVAGANVMTLRIASGGGVLNLAAIAGDPAAPANGDVWYNSSTGKFRGRAAGASVDLH